MVGLKNQGARATSTASCRRYTTGKFRRAVYKVPTESDASDTGVVLALQRLFWQLQSSQHSVHEESDGCVWLEKLRSFRQHDIELNRILMDRVEERMKATDLEGQCRRCYWKIPLVCPMHQR